MSINRTLDRDVVFQEIEARYREAWRNGARCTKEAFNLTVLDVLTISSVVGAEAFAELSHVERGKMLREWAKAEWPKILRGRQ